MNRKDIVMTTHKAGQNKDGGGKKADKRIKEY